MNSRKGYFTRYWLWCSRVHQMDE